MREVDGCGEGEGWRKGLVREKDGCEGGVGSGEGDGCEGRVRGVVREMGVREE